MKLLITGCGRSGTNWIARAITKAGVKCGHERVFTLVPSDQEKRWKAESSWVAAPLTPMEGVYVVHLVRHPLRVIRSRLDASRMQVRWDHRRGRPYLEDWAAWATRWCPNMDLTGPPMRAWANHWVQWTRLVVADEELRVEEVGANDVNRLAQIVNPEAPGLSELPAPSNVTESPSKPLTWQEVSDVPGLRLAAERFGYL